MRRTFSIVSLLILMLLYRLPTASYALITACAAFSSLSISDFERFLNSIFNAKLLCSIYPSVSSVIIKPFIKLCSKSSDDESYHADLLNASVFCILLGYLYSFRPVCFSTDFLYSASICLIFNFNCSPLYCRPSRIFITHS